MNKKLIGIIIGIIILIIIVAFGVLYFNTDGNNNEEEVGDTTTPKVYNALYNDILLSTGMTFNEDLIDEEYTYSEITSCAFDGIDKVYTYEGVEITVAEDNGEDIIYSIYFLSSDTKTESNLGITDSIDDMLNTYGEDFEEPVDNKYIYTFGNTEIIFITDNDYIISIEYLLITE